jgi:hypothetical protein
VPLDGDFSNFLTPRGFVAADAPAARTGFEHFCTPRRMLPEEDEGAMLPRLKATASDRFRRSNFRNAAPVRF